MDIRREAREIPVRNECDVLVVGAGPAGFGAAVSAARAGARTTLVEYGGKLGGMWTLGLLSPFFDNHHHDGLNRELREALQARGCWGGLWDISFDPTEMAMLLDELALDAGIDILFYTMATEPIMEDGVLKGVVVENKSGPQAILAKTVVDCTGDGDIAARAGAPFEIGGPEGACQPMTMMFKIGGVKAEYGRDDTIGFYKALTKVVAETDVLSGVPFNNPAIIKLPREGEALIQWTHVRHCLGTDGDELSKATLEGRRQIRRAMELFKAIRPVLGDVYLMELPMVVGVRETRRVKGEYYVTDDDVKEGRRHEDGICLVHFGVDIHEPSKSTQTCFGHKGFDIPLRSLVPLGVENLLTAGRCISGSFVAHAAYRVTGDCLKMGEAAGVMAAVAAARDVSVRHLARKEPGVVMESINKGGKI